MKKVILSAMMMMAMMCFTTNVNAQDNVKKEKKECCEKKQQEKKECCEKNKKCTECKAECGDKGCKECPNNHKCKKNCKK